MGVLTTSQPKTFQRMLADHAAERPEHPFLVTRERQLTYADAHQASNRVAHVLREAGVQRGDRVAIMMHSGIDFIIAWFGICKVGALAVPFNEAYLGDMLRNQAREIACSIAIVEDSYVDRWAKVAEDLPALELVFVHGEAAPTDAPWRLRAFEELLEGSSEDVPDIVDYTDPMALLYTSGTTGPSKGVMYGYGQAYANAAPLAAHCTSQDVFYMFLPMFHTGLPHCLGTVLISGATMAIRPKFSRTQFWADVSYFQATVTLLISAMPGFLLANPVREDDAENTLDRVFMTPLPRRMEEFATRFGCKLATLYNMTEVSSPIVSDFTISDPRSCGRVRPGIDARLVNDRDEEVAHGEVGELVLRADQPWEMNLGYWQNPEATAEAWRNQWLHTGDLLTRDEAGNFFFVDRKKDVIRRRGENISAYELEQSVLAHPQVREAAAIAVPASVGEDEALIVVRCDNAEEIEPAELRAFLAERLPAYMVPRYIRVQQEELPRTPTDKIQKATLRERGASGAWDAEEAVQQA